MLFSKDDPEKKAFEGYRKAVNKMCQKCNEECRFRNKREQLKTGLKGIYCQKEFDNLLAAAMKSKLP